MEAITEFVAVGRRKEAVARVRLRPGEGSISINGRKLEDYFPRETHRITALNPFKLTETTGKLNLLATITGGGPTGQAGALRHGISRALLKYDENLRKVLRSAGFLTRDPRSKERKKYGRKRARKSFQFSKR
ncbi:MAG: 30S ribosomal protein S9 [Candidatus Omnitrophica bacterium]|nr:30S ribosomal protein S9 [Candidatus Omnitrophota bacterium]